MITDIQAYHADKKDSLCLEDIINRLYKRLWRSGFLLENCIADTGYSSGEVYAYLEKKGITSFIPPHGTYKGGPEGFIYHKKEDYYQCPKGKIIPFKKVFLDYRTQTKKKEYRGSSKLCKTCPIKNQCLRKTAKEKKFSVTYYQEEYERDNKRVNSKKGGYMKGKRQSTVEPVFGTLTQFMGLRKINTLGIKQANKVMHVSAMAYNLKKYLKFIKKTIKSKAKTINTLFLIKLMFIGFIYYFLSHSKLKTAYNY